MSWKPFLKRALAVLLLVLLGAEVYMEFRYPCDEIFIASTDTKKILRRVPEAVITEEDKALWAELLELPSVQGLLEGGEDGYLYASENPDVAAAAEEYLSGEEAGSLSVNVLFVQDGSSVTYISWKEGGSFSFLQITPEESGPVYYKIYCPKRGTSYENWDNEQAQKSEVHRRWFAWLRDGLWKEGE